MPIFNADTPSRRSAVVRYLNAKIKAPFVSSQVSTLGGVNRASAIVHVSLDPKSSWANGIFQNSRYFLMHISRDGTMEMFSKSYRLKDKMRKSKVASLPVAVAKINKYIAGVK